jgi:hypothetical protein
MDFGAGGTGLVDLGAQAGSFLLASMDSMCTDHKHIQPFSPCSAGMGPKELQLART